MENLVRMGNPKHHQQPLKTVRKITVIPSHMADALHLLGQSTKICVSEHIRRAIQKYLLAAKITRKIEVNCN